MAARKKRALTAEEQLEAALVPEEEWPYELPDNWCWVRLGEATEIIMGQSPLGTSVSDDRTQIPLIGGASDMTVDSLVATRYTSQPTKLSKEGDIVVCVRATLGNPVIANDTYCLGRGVGAIRTNIMNRSFICRFIDSATDYLFAHATGSTFQQVSGKVLGDTPLPLPPLPEQERIASRIEWLFAKLDDAEAELREIIDNSEQRQAAILHRAFNGALTEQWRRKCEGHNASSIADIAAFAKDWKTKDRRLLAEQQAKCIERNLDRHTWTECTVGAIGRVTNGSTPSRKVSTYWGGDIPWVSSGEVRNNIITETHECITNEGYNSSSVNLLPAGTVLIAMIGEGKTRGQSGILDIPATINQNVAAVVIDHGHVDPRFLWYWFKYSYRRNREAGSGTGPQALNCQRVRELPFILPEKDEQEEIVRLLDALLEREQQTQFLASSALEAIGNMRQAILSKAVHGELGTNDPAEPSSKELLASILGGNTGK